MLKLSAPLIRESRYFSKTSASEMQRDGVLRSDVRNFFKVSCRCDLFVIVPGVAFRHTSFWKAEHLLPSSEKNVNNGHGSSRT